MSVVCGICACKDFSPNVFKVNQCNNCSHDHSRSIDDLPIWEREALATKHREDEEARELENRLSLREEAKATLSQRKVHRGCYVPWFKLVGTPKGFQNAEMGAVWTCCGDESEKSQGCTTMEISDLHQPCFRCGANFYPFELPQSCRHHTSKLQWREVADASKFRWECCDRLSHEEGCKSHFTHVL